jgi:hypothetical protein
VEVMANIIATVKSIDGKFFAKDAEGVTVELKEGDPIYEGMVVFGDASNAAASKIELSREDGLDDIVLLADQEQSFDASLTEESSVEDAIFTDSMDALLDDTAALDEEIYSDEEVVEEEKFDEEDTDAGDEKIKADEAGGEFAARDGNAVDVNSGLRSAKFQASSHSFEIEDRFQTESEERLTRIDTPNDPTPPDRPTIIAAVTPPTLVTSQATPPPVIEVAPVIPNVSINDVVIDEQNGFMVFTVSTNVPAPSDITFDFVTNNNSAIAGSDYDATTGSGVIAAGESSTTIRIPVLDDYYNEADENYGVTLTSVSTNALLEDGVGIGTILDDGGDNNLVDDTVYVKLIDSDSVAEGDTLSHGIKLVDANGNDVLLKSGESITVSLNYTGSGTNPASASDYTAQTSVTITGSAAGNNVASISNATIDDFFAEGIEQYTISVGTISDNGNTF